MTGLSTQMLCPVINNDSNNSNSNNSDISNDCGNNDFAHCNNHLPVVMFDVVPVRQEVEGAVRRGACAQMSKWKDLNRGNANPVCRKWICNGVSAAKRERMEG